MTYQYETPALWMSATFGMMAERALTFSCQIGLLVCYMYGNFGIDGEIPPYAKTKEGLLSLYRNRHGSIGSVIENKQGHEIAGYVEEAKVRLSSSERTEVSLEHFEKGLICAVSKAQFEDDITDERLQITQAIDRSLQSAGVSADKIDTVFLTGGSTYIPSVKAACIEHLPTARVIEGDKFGSVGMGLAIQSRVIFGDPKSMGFRPVGGHIVAFERT